MTKSAAAAAASRRSMTDQGLSTSESEMTQKSWPERSADAAGGGERRGDAGLHLDLDVPPAVRVELELLEHRAGHGEHARVAGRDDDDVAARGAEVERQLGPVGLDPVAGSVPPPGRGGGDAVEVRAVADEVGGGRQ